MKNSSTTLTVGSKTAVIVESLVRIRKIEEESEFSPEIPCQLTNWYPSLGIADILIGMSLKYSANNEFSGMARPAMDIVPASEGTAETYKFEDLLNPK